MRARVAEAVAAHQSDSAAFLQRLPLVESPNGPDAHPILERIPGNIASIPAASRDRKIQRALAIGVDCGVLYFLTGESDYAQVAADILYACVEAMVQMAPKEGPFNDGLIFELDHLYEARVIGAQLPLLYDFTANFLRSGAEVFDVRRQQRVPFNFDNAQQVFRTYARLVLERGIVDCNWPVLEMPSLAHNALALESEEERRWFLDRLTHVDTEHQDSLRKVVEICEEAGGVWPESPAYAGSVANLATYIGALLIRQNPAVALPEDFTMVPLSLVRLQDFRLPDGGFVRFGDSRRRAAFPFTAYQLAYHIGAQTDHPRLKTVFGQLIAEGLRSGEFRRNPRHEYVLGPYPFNDPLALLWFEDEPVVDPAATSPEAEAVTDHLPFAGLVLQRNLSPTGATRDALAAAVIGGDYIHGHASGMALELFGAGIAFGTHAGHGTYRSDEHENYRRIFASHNGVIVNGSSSTSGEWVNLGTDTVRILSIEPRLGESPVTPAHSFALMGFTDRQIQGTEAPQERLVGIVRTSPTTGYYVDVFRSKTTTEEQFHDYLFHNIGDAVMLQAGDRALELRAQPDRFPPADGTQWRQNAEYLYPGWHFFSDIEASGETAESILAEFAADRMETGGGRMRLFIPGNERREYARAMAPSTRDAPSPYTEAPTPVLVIRQHGSAWSAPFAVIHEPFFSDGGEGSVRSVEALMNANGEFSGFEVVSFVEGELIIQFVLVLPSSESRFEDTARGIFFEGRYGIITCGGDEGLRSLYIGEGSQLRFKDRELSAQDRGAAWAAF